MSPLTTGSLWPSSGSKFGTALEMFPLSEVASSSISAVTPTLTLTLEQFAEIVADLLGAVIEAGIAAFLGQGRADTEVAQREEETRDPEGAQDARATEVFGLRHGVGRNVS